MPEYKTALLTIPKAGSQWIRDVLSAPQIAVKNNFSLVEPRENETHPQKNLEEWKKQWNESTGGSFFAPVYNIPSSIWREISTPRDRAVVVLRDPRDMLVSWMYSQCYSHGANRITGIWRNLMLSIPMRARMALAVLRFNVWKGTYDSWAVNQNDANSNYYVTSYETILNRQETEFAKIVQFLGWRVAEEEIAKITSDLSFYKRSGRKQGDGNPASHYRKGVSGDWKNHFDQKTGKFFEVLYPNLLIKLGYEKSDHWYETLNNDLDTNEDIPVNTSLGETTELQAEIDRLTAKFNEERIVSESTIQSLTEAAHDRKVLCEKLVVENQKKEEEIHMLAIAVKELQTQNELQHNEIKNLLGVCEERLRLIDFLDNALKNRKK